jgi:hypothetical protein
MSDVKDAGHEAGLIQINPGPSTPAGHAAGSTK